MKKPDDEFDDETPSPEDYEVRDYVEKLPGYQEYIRENQGDGLNFGDY